MWKIKFINRSEESQVVQEEGDLDMKTKKNDGDDAERDMDNSAEKNIIKGDGDMIIDLDCSVEKKLKQARLPFKILSPKSSAPDASSDSGKSVKKRKLSDDSTVEVSKSKLCKTDTKENLHGPSSRDVIVLEDSTDLPDSEKNVICSNETDSHLEEKSKTYDDLNTHKKRVLNSGDDSVDNENNNDDKIKKKLKISSRNDGTCCETNESVINKTYSTSLALEVGCDDSTVIIEENDNDVTSKTSESGLDDKNVSGSDLSKSVNKSVACYSKSGSNLKSNDTATKKNINHGNLKCSKSKGRSNVNNKNKKVVKNTHKSNDIKSVFQKLQLQKIDKTINSSGDVIHHDEGNLSQVSKKISSACKNEDVEIIEDNVECKVVAKKSPKILKKNSSTVRKIVNKISKTSVKNNNKRGKNLVKKSPKKKSAIQDMRNEISDLAQNNYATANKDSLKIVKCSPVVLVKKMSDSNLIALNKGNKTSTSDQTSLKISIECTVEHPEVSEINCSGVKKPSNLVLKSPEEIKKISSDAKETPLKIDAESDSYVSEDNPRDNSISSNTDNCCNKTPKPITKRRLTPKQISKKQESEKKRLEREQQKLEKERLKKEKEEKINQMKEERIRLKTEREEIKKREKEEKDKKRQMEIELKNEEKRAKEEEKKVKEEEKKKREEAKEEEKRKRDEAKEEERKKKEAMKRKEEKAATAFANFFTPKRSENKSLSSSTEDVTDSSVGVVKFMPFEVKADMRLAAIHRRILEIESKTALDCALLNKDFGSCDLYINKLRSKQHIPLSEGKTWSLLDDAEDDIIVIESEVVECDNEEEEKSNCEKKRTQRPRAKLLQFHENRRPPYWGTWRKKSSVIGPRKPFGQDNGMFEYDIDSDEEWEEEEPGESLHGSDDDKESEDEYEVDNQVFVPHGYLSDEEAQDEIEDLSPEAQKAKLQFLEMEFEAEMKEKMEKLKPRLIGCVWFNNSVEDPKLVGSHIAELLLSRRAVLWDHVTVPINTEPSNSLSSSPSSTPAKSEQNRNIRSNIFPESAVPLLIKLVHGNRFKHKFLIEEFYNYLSLNSKSVSELPSKNAISNKKREISEWMVYPQEENSNHQMIGRRCWYVSKELRDKYGVLEQTSNDKDAWMYSLEVPRSNISSNSPSVIEQTPPANPITKFTKILSQEERQKQLTLSSTSLISSSTDKLSSSTPLSSKKSAKVTSSRKARRSVMDSFMKSKSIIQKDDSFLSAIKIIELSPEKPCSSSIKNTLESKDIKTALSKISDSNVSSLGRKVNESKITKLSERDCSSEKTPTVKPASAKTKKRIKPISLSPMKHRKKL